MNIYKLTLTRKEVYHLQMVLKQAIMLSQLGVCTEKPEDKEHFLAQIELSKDLARRIARLEAVK
ncbi:TPA_asm: hypothetical protein GEK33_02425 [Listeria monocytogenes]|nr:hypothetical protein [Listeria monocytogenes]HAA2887784.1 hypothetical protein [Listeria monocytogenes]